MTGFFDGLLAILVAAVLNLVVIYLIRASAPGRIRVPREGVPLDGSDPLLARRAVERLCDRFGGRGGVLGRFGLV